ncbi:MAG TPA: carboxypeptidase-like regulatory domain-containing protein [Gemmatimonadaceae bacterium]|nr:carboxypeptidase-like regulatory domain-containing protein [Gemmatimonadaceae bacterium]
MKHLFPKVALALSALAQSELTAQAGQNLQAPRPAMSTGSLSGTVTDSLGENALSGALVSVSQGRYIATTDSLGSFRLDSVAVGSHRVDVTHPLLSALRYPLARDVTVAAGQKTTLSFFLPSLTAVASTLCPPILRARGPALLAGRVLDAQQGLPLEGARVTYVWGVVDMTASGVRQVPRVREATSGPDGSYLICGLPAEVEGTIQAQHGSVATPEVRFAIGAKRFPTFELFLDVPAAAGRAEGNAAPPGAGTRPVAPPTSATASAPAGPAVRPARIVGRILDPGGKPIPGAMVSLGSDALGAQSGGDGRFSFSSTRLGTSTLTVRRVGYLPRDTVVSLRAGAAIDIDVVLTVFAPVLPEVRVTGTANQGLVRVGFEDRKRRGTGFFLDFLERQSSLPTVLSDIFSMVPGMIVRGSGIARRVESSRSPGGCVAFTVDNVPFESASIAELDAALPPSEIAAIEVYHGSTTPEQFKVRGAGSCTTVVIWSMTRAGR